MIQIIRFYSYLIVLLCLCITPMATSSSAEASESFLLTLGQQKTINAPDIKRIAVGDPNVADVKALEKTGQILITARGTGRTNLILWNDNNQERVVLIDVVSSDPEKIAEELRLLLGGVEGITIKPAGKRVLIDGYVLKKSDLDKIDKIAALHPQTMILATLSPGVVDLAVEQINKEFAANNLHNATATKLANKIALEGDVDSEEEKQKAEIIANIYSSNIINFLNAGVKIRDLINISVDFIELNKKDEKKIGIDWEKSLSVGGDAAGLAGFGSSGNPSSFGGSYSLSASYGATINALHDSGNSRILAQPKLLCRSGDKAEFLAGGEVAIPIVTSDTTSVEYKEYGLILKISPTADNKGNIETSIEVEHSSIVGYTANMPNLRTSRVSTFVNGKNNQTIVLSGLINNTDLKGVGKLPGLGEIPILGELFKSRQFSNNESELLIFITPTIVNNSADELPAEVKEIRAKYDTAGENVKFKMMD